MSVVFQSIAPGNGFELDPDSFLDRNHRSHLEFECRESRACLVNGRWIVTVHQHMPAPFAHSHYEQLDFEICGRLPFSEHIKYSLLGILVLYRRTLRAFEPTDHVLQEHPPLPSKCFMISSLLPASNIVSSLLKRMFVSLKDMESEDADQFLICEFKGYD
jgi:hypothetical protein